MWEESIVEVLIKTSSESVSACVIILSQAVPGESGRMLLTNEVPHVNSGKLMSFVLFAWVC